VLDRALPISAALLLLSACDCSPDEPLPTREPQPAEAAPAEPTPDEWPTAQVPDLPPATPATVVTVRSARIDVDNHDLVATWPAPAVERARGEAPAGRADWPRLSIRLDEPSADGSQIPALSDALETARRAERASTGAGSGAGVYNLRVANDVPYETVERVLYTASLAGYRAPRLLLRAGRGERMMPWPRGAPRSADAPTEEEIAAALESVREGAGAETPALGDAPGPEREARGTEADEPRAPAADAPGTQPGSGDDLEPEAPEPRDPRLDLAAESISGYLGDALQAPRCERDAEADTELTLTADADVEAIGRCLRRLRERGEGDALTLTVLRTLPFGRVVTVLQRATRVFESVRLVGR
jgi:hypothetical protein